MNYVPMNYMETVIIRTEIKLTTTTVNIHVLTAALEKIGLNIFNAGAFAYRALSPDTLMIYIQ